VAALRPLLESGVSGKPDDLQFAVVGHVEWVHFVHVRCLPTAGEIIESDDWWVEAAGGGAVAAVQLAKLAGGATFFTALGDDDAARRSRDQLSAHGVELQAAARERPQRRAVAFLEASGERTIIVIGERLVPVGADELPWKLLEHMDGVYFTGGDVAALRAARAARTLVATPRAREALTGSGVNLDALVLSGNDAAEGVAAERVGWSADLVCTTRGARGGTYATSDGRNGSFQAAPLPGPIVDSYGAGDSFAAGLTFGLGSGLDVDAALALAARCGAGNMTGRGAYEGQPTAAELDSGMNAS
jgi:ribokinase